MLSSQRALLPSPCAHFHISKSHSLVQTSFSLSPSLVCYQAVSSLSFHDLQSKSQISRYICIGLQSASTFLTGCTSSGHCAFWHSRRHFWQQSLPRLCNNEVLVSCLYWTLIESANVMSSQHTSTGLGIRSVYALARITANISRAAGTCASCRPGITEC